jgi:hypothetical protein
MKEFSVKFHGTVFRKGDRVRVLDREGNETGEEGVIEKLDEGTNQVRLDIWTDPLRPELRTKWVGPEKLRKVVEPKAR